MAAESIPVLSNKSSNQEIIDKALKILSAIEQCRCDHCTRMLKESLAEKWK
jgi:hypothetical protein